MGIVGTRPSWLTVQRPEWECIKTDVLAFLATLRGQVVVSGGAPGVDTLVWMNYAGPKSIVFADWEKHGKKAGLIRNGEIVEMVDEVHAWPSSWSRGTWDTIRKAQAAGKPCMVHRPWEEQ